MTAATITAASSARAERAEKRVSSVKLPSNPFAGKQYLGLILPLALIALWYILSTNGVFTQVQLPSPDRVVSAGVELAQRGELGRHVAISTQRVLIGFGIGAVLWPGAGCADWLVCAGASDCRTDHWCATCRAVPGVGSVASAVDRYWREFQGDPGC